MLGQISVIIIVNDVIELHFFTSNFGSLILEITGRLAVARSFVKATVFASLPAFGFASFSKRASEQLSTVASATIGPIRRNKQ